jgi:MFS superfamily sulfate permease-like transporter
MAEHQDGQSTAAWTAVSILLLASFLICLSVVVKSWPVAIVGVVLIVVGVAAGKILAMAGFGQTRPESSPEGSEAPRGTEAG